MLKVIEPMKKLSRKVVGYCTYRLFKLAARYDENVAHKLYRMEKKTAVQMTDISFSERRPM